MPFLNVHYPHRPGGDSQQICESMELGDNDAFWEEIVSNTIASTSSSIQKSFGSNCLLDLDQESILVNVSEGGRMGGDEGLASPFDLPPEEEEFRDHLLTQLEEEESLPSPSTRTKSQEQMIKVIPVEEWSRDKSTLLSLLASIEQLGLGIAFPLESLIGTNADLEKKYKIAQR